MAFSDRDVTFNHKWVLFSNSLNAYVCLCVVYFLAVPCVRVRARARTCVCVKLQKSSILVDTAIVLSMFYSLLNMISAQFWLITDV